MAHVLSIDSFVPTDQATKLAMIEDAKSVLEVTLAARPDTARPSPDEIRQAAKDALAAIDPSLAKLPADHPLAAIADDLRKLSTAPDPIARSADESLTRYLPTQLAQLRTALSAQPVAAKDVPAEIARDWVLPDGRARLQVVPTPAAQDSEACGASSTKRSPLPPMPPAPRSRSYRQDRPSSTRSGRRHSRRSWPSL
ncbi:MAG: hypothetical protein WDN69_19765 [Aliidongia sp.]